jgi:hypothetical protein
MYGSNASAPFSSTLRSSSAFFECAALWNVSLAQWKPMNPLPFLIASRNASLAPGGMAGSLCRSLSGSGTFFPSGPFFCANLSESFVRSPVV